MNPAPLSKEKLLKIHSLMALSRRLDEKLISMYKKGQSYFWIGAPGEEAIGVSLGLLAQKGQGMPFDWLHLHYRCTGVAVALGVKTKDVFRMMMNKKTDPFSRGKNFVHHYCIPEWNIPPVTSIVETQHSWAIGTAYAQTQEPTKAISIVTGGDAGTALGDFASSLVWASRPTNSLPLLIIVMNNMWGISTPYSSQHGEKSIAARAQAFGFKTFSVDGHDAIKAYHTVREGIRYVREERRPALISARVSRLYGHSSADGANYKDKEECVLKNFEKYLIEKNLLSQNRMKEIYAQMDEKLNKEAKEVSLEEEPSSKDSIWSHIYANSEPADWRKF